MISVSLTNDGDAASASIDIELPTGLSFVDGTRKGSVVFSDRAEGMGNKSSNIRSNGALRVGMAFGSISAGTGELFTFKIKADENATLGTVKISYSSQSLTINSAKVNIPDMQSDVEIYKEYTVTATSSSETMGSVSGAGNYKNGTNATLTATANTGYEFVKWSNDVTDNPYVFAVTSDVTLTATFQVITYTITYNLNGGSLTTDKNSYTIETETFTLDTPTRTGYDFGGWFDNADFTGDAITQIAKGSTGDKTFYAKWTPTTYTKQQLIPRSTPLRAMPSR